METSGLKHRGCGGELYESEDKPYPYVHEAWEQEERVEYHARLLCRKCGTEITGDPQIEEPDEL